MHKKITSELKQLAQEILDLENNASIEKWHIKAQRIYEQLTVLKFVENNLNETFDNEQKEGEAIKINEPEVVEEAIKYNTEVEEDNSENIVEEIIEIEPIAEAEPPAKDINPNINIEKYLDEEVVKVEENIEKKRRQFSLEDEFKEAISADEATTMFEAATKESPEIKELTPKVKRSLNDALFQGNIQIGLNDRIAFVKHLFNGSQEDFNRVLSQLNSFETEKDAVKFIQKMVKPDYNWEDNLTYEERFMDLIARKFN